MRRSLGRALVPLLAAVLLPACGSDGTGTPPPPALQVEATGRAERGSEVLLVVTREGQVVDPAAVQWTADPADAVQVLGAGRVRLLREGRVEISASFQGSSGKAAVQVALPPTVVFEKVADGNRDIWRVALDGGGLARVTTTIADDQDPTAARGTVVFVTFRHGSADLYSVPLAGGTEVRLTTTARHELSPSLSPDGERLAFTADDSGVPKVWTSAANGTGAARATPTSFGSGGSLEASPAWAPSGNRLVFAATNNGLADIFSVTLPGTPSLLVGGDSTDIEPAWSPDGTRVVVASRREGDLELYLYTFGATGLVRLTRHAGSDSQPAWLPDGRLVYTSNVNGTLRLFWMDPANPSATYEIPTGPGAAQKASGVF